MIGLVIEGDEDEEDKDRDDEGKPTARAMKRTSLERNDYEEEGDLGQDNDGECQEDEDNDVNEDDEDNDGEIGEIATTAIKRKEFKKKKSATKLKKQW